MNRILIILILMMPFGLSKSIQKKVNKQIVETFNVEEFSFTEVIIDLEIAKTLPSSFGKDNLFKIETEESFLGYAYVSKAFGKVDYFDYLVLLDKDLVILKTKILVYREDYGGEIGSKRWLKQFIGKTTKRRVKIWRQYCRYCRRNYFCSGYDKSHELFIEIVKNSSF